MEERTYETDEFSFLSLEQKADGEMVMTRG